MISPNIVQILKENSKIKDFLKNIKDFDIDIKNLSQKEIIRINLEYPDLLKNKPESKNYEDSHITCITLIKSNLDSTSYVKISKFKIYVDNLNGDIIKILQK